MRSPDAEIAKLFALPNVSGTKVSDRYLMRLAEREGLCPSRVASAIRGFTAPGRRDLNNLATLRLGTAGS